MAQKINLFSYQALLGKLFRARSSGVRAQKKRTSDHHMNETFKRKAFKACKKVVNKTYNYEFMMRLLTCRSLIFGKNLDEQVTNA